MKKTKKILSILLVCILAFSATAFPASAVIAPDYRGDANRDGEIDVSDVTYIQKYLAGMVELTKREYCLADTDVNGCVSIVDVTLLQKYLAGMIKGHFEDYIINKYPAEIDGFWSNFDSGMAVTDAPVVFDVRAVSGRQPYSYEYYVNDRLARGRSDKSYFEYTFQEAGTYKIKVVSYNAFDETDSYETDFTVVEPYSDGKPVISSIQFDRFEVIENYGFCVMANGAFGNAPYEYKFIIDNGLYTQDFSESNSFTVEYDPLRKIEKGTHTVEVQLKESGSDEIFTRTLEFEVVGRPAP